MNSPLYPNKMLARGDCPCCGDRVTIYRRAPVHGVHAIITLMTVGLWSVAWLAVWIGQFRLPWRCRRCREIVAHPSRQRDAWQRSVSTMAESIGRQEVRR